MGKSGDGTDGTVDPTEFLRALLKISPEDAAKAREEAGKSGTTATTEPGELPES